jgi:O-antigen ligase
VPYHPIVERFPIVPALDPLWLLAFTVLFAGSAVLTMRRPGWGAALLVFVTPFAGAHAIFGTTLTAPKAMLIGVVVGLLGAPGAWKMLARRPAIYVAGALGAVVVATGLSIVVAVHPVETVRETLKWTQYLALFCAILVAYAADPAERLVRIALFTSILVVVASAFSDLALGATSGLMLGSTVVPRIAGVLEGPNQFGGYLEAAIAAVGAWHMHAPRRTSALLLFAAGAALALTFSRAAFFATLVILLIFALLEPRRIAQLWTLLAGFALGYVNDVIWAIRAHVSFLSIFERESDISGEGTGIGDRAELWRAARFFFVHHPLLGIGAGNYQLELAEAGLPGVRTQANSWYLQAAAEGGIVLLGATVVWILTVLRTLAAYVRASPWALAGFAASAAFALHGFFDDLVFYPKVAEAWIALVALGIAEPLAHKSRSRT